MRQAFVVPCVVLLGCGFHTTGDLPPGATTTTATTVTTSATISTSSSFVGTGGASSSSSSAGGAGGSSSSSSGTAGMGGAVATGGATSTGGMDAGPTTFASCKELHDAQPSNPDGVYDITPPAGAAYKAYCDMTTSGGGWTLALKIDGNKDTFYYDKAIWTDANGLNEDKPDLDNVEAKLPSFWSVPVTELRIGMADAGALRWLVVPVTGASLQEILGGPAMTTMLGNESWKGLLESGSIQTNCNWEGINVLDRVRIGLLGDESGDCLSSPTPDSFIGLGGKVWYGQTASGNRAGYSPDNGDKDTKTFSYVFVR